MPHCNLMLLRQRLRLPALAALLATPALAEAQNHFGQGQTRVSLSAGASAGSGGSSYQLGVGLGYYLLDGLELGVDTRSWMGGSFRAHEVAPSLTYVFHNLGNFLPYGGLLYRRTFIHNRENLSAYGARAGIYLQQSPNLVLRAGVAAHRYQNCNRATGLDCTDIYPEISAGFYF